MTPTASGKSLIYQVPALTAARGPAPHRSLFLFPYKALAQDQLGAIESLAREARPVGPARAAIYDGDTPPAERRRIKADLPEILLTNPDMLHLGLLAHHGSWAELFRTLRYVVVDELHVYRGIFGAHLHHVLRRLRRLCRHYGSDPRFLVSSATVGNPREFGEMLLGLPLTIVDRSGAPRAARHFFFLNPPASPYTAAAHLLVASMDAGLRTIAFTKARRITELVHRWITAERPDLRRLLASYRAGYLPEERRDIERRLFAGDLRGVVSTSALELGVDVGGLDVCILVGYPGSIVRFWQRIGRVGRRERESAVILIGMPDALDQYLLRHPEEFFARRFEKAVADPSNPTVARAHLVCASAELPLPAGAEEPEFLPGTLDRARGMLSTGELVLDADGRRYYSLRRAPQRDVNLRAGGSTYTIVGDDGQRVVGQIDGVRAFHECHPGAIYLHGGAQYRVESLDLDRRRIRVVPSDDDYYTEVRSEKETEILEILREEAFGVFRAGLGRLRVTEEIKGFHRRRLFRQEVLSSESLELPPIVFETEGLWLDLPEAVADGVRLAEGHFMGAIHAVEHATISLFPLLTLADRGDLGGISYPLHPQTGRAAIFIYDGHPGGMGLAARGFEELAALLDRTRELLQGCPCDDGCPSCIHSPKCGNGNKPLDKAAASWVLDVLTGTEALTVEPPMRPLELRPPADLSVGVEEPPSAGAAVPVEKAGPAPETSPDRADRPAGEADLRDAWRPGAGASFVSPTRSAPEAAPPRPAPVAPRPGPRGSGAAARGEAPAARPPRVLPDDARIVAFDLETQRSAEEVGGWGNVRDMGLALGVVEDIASGESRSYREHEVQSLILDLLGSDLVVGFNIKRFDYLVLEAYARPGIFRRLPTVDLLEQIHRALGFRVKLGSVAAATLGESKTADGLQSLQWYREGRLDLIEEYCRQDVRVTAELFRYGRQHGYLLYPDREGRAMRVPVAW